VFCGATGSGHGNYAITDGALTNTIGPYNLDRCYCGDSRQLAADIPDQSIDLIICDPVYWWIADYAWLAQLAGRVLKPGGAVLAQCGEVFLYDAWLAFRTAGSELYHIPPIIEVISFATATYQIGPVRMSSGYHAYIAALRSPRKVSIINRHHGKRDKAFHKWGDGLSFAWQYISVLTEPGAVVFDPFAGGATVGVAAKMLGRRSLSFEIDPATAAAASARIDNCQLPLIAMPATQQIISGI
jgi:DNA modification methylase